MERLIAEFRRRWLEAFDKEWAVNGRMEAEQMAAEHEAAQPVAWAALRDDGDIAWIGYTPEGAADGARGRQIVPLYRQPQPMLTDAEREAVDMAIDLLSGVEDVSAGASSRADAAAATLRGLLERLAAANSGDDRRSGGGE